ncbi:MAG: M15 family metallopeptidase [Spirochaetia bacterium]|nr:M15 family metallopeptidase [Spirochaetia bacterium]
MNTLINDLLKNPDFVEVGYLPYVTLDLRYGTTNNFMCKNIYQDFNRAFLHKVAAQKFLKAIENLKKVKPFWKFLLFDCLRPARAHQQLWDFVAGTPQESYVANPDRGSLHSFGFAVDLTLVDENNNMVDMGTDFDSFEDLAQPKYELKMLEMKLLTEKQINNRLILRKIMESAGFYQLSFEWWHYDADEGNNVRTNYQLIK